MNITIGWWAIAAAFAALAWGLWPTKATGYGGDVIGAICFLGSLVVILAAWLVWALLS